MGSARSEPQALTVHEAAAWRHRLALISTAGIMLHTAVMIVGRRDEFARAVAALRSGPGLVVLGEAGVGKSALVAAAVDGRRVRRGQCFRSLAWTPLLPLQQALGRPVPIGDPAWTARWVAHQCVDGVLVLDDLQWADALTLEVIAALPSVVTVAVTVRSGDPGTAAALDTVGPRLQVLELAPLPEGDAAELAVARHPRLRPVEAVALARRCGGNPLLIEELGTDPSPSAGLRRTLVGRVRRLGDDAWTAFAMLTLADEPLPASWIEQADALIDAGLVVIEDGLARPRHALLAEVMSTELADLPVQQRAIHADLGELAAADGRGALAARAFAAAGLTDRGLGLALAAARESTRPGERAGLLLVAARCARPDRSGELAAEAVGQLVDAGYYAPAAALLEQLPPRTDARWQGLVGRVRWEAGRGDEAIAAYKIGLADAGATPEDLLLVQIEYARAVVLALGDIEHGLDLARAALERAEVLGVEQARATAVVGTCEAMAGVPGAADRLARAVSLSASAGNLMVEFTSANNLIATHESDGDLELARVVADRYAKRADELHLRTWMLQMRAMECNTAMHLGAYDDVIAIVPQLLAGTPDARTIDQLTVTLCLALTDLGRQQDALERLEDAFEATAANDYYGRGSLLFARAEALLWSGDAEAALRDATEAVSLTPTGGHQLFPLLTLAHAQWRLGRPVVEAVPDAHAPVTEAAPHEHAGYVALGGEDVVTAHEQFARAAGLWRGRHRRGELRCAWLAAHTDPNDEAGRAALLALETELDGLGWQPLLGQVRRSLRDRGVRRSAPRERSGELTAREREVLELVARGMSTEQIGASLGLSPRTVAAQIASARSRLGAVNRWQAASDS